MTKIPVEELSGEIEKELNAYAEGCTDVVKKSVKDTASDIKKDIEAKAPVGATGKYAKSWRTKKTTETGSSVSYVVHANKDGYRLAHLLEFGHALRNGGRSKAFPHIKPAEESGKKELEERIRGGLK